MKDNSEFDVRNALEDIGEAVMDAVAYKPYPLKKLESVMKSVDDIISNRSYLKECENHFKSAGSNYVLFFLSNIIYNLKKKGELVLTSEVMKWLGSVWSNFLKRNMSYQERFPLINEYKIKLNKYYPGGGSFINQIENVNLIKEDFITAIDSKENPLMALEKFYQLSSDLLAAMKPSYFFLLDYYYERKINTGIDIKDGTVLETQGLVKFGHFNYTYGEIAILACQALGILEAAYLIIKKKKSSRRLVSVDGKQKFLTAPEIYNMYLEKFNETKKELTNLNK